MSPVFLKVTGWFFLFSLFHSITAHEWFKVKLARVTGKYFVDYYWRLIYCAISVFMIKYGVCDPLYQAGIGTMPVMQFPEWYLNLTAITFFFGVLITYWAYLQFDILEFLGIRQCCLGLKGSFTGTMPPSTKIAGTDRLVAKGIYKVVRHPMLAGAFLMAISGPPYAGTYLYSVLFFVYMVIGVYYEERRLVRNLGTEYTAYKNEVGAFFPKLSQFRRWLS